VAVFTGTPTSGVAPLSVSFASQSTGSPTSFLYNFGDGITSTLANVVHVYSNPGTYTVSLTTSNTNGSNTLTKNNYIAVTTPASVPVAVFTGTPTSGISPLSVSFTSQSTGSPTSFLYNFGDGITSTLANVVHVYSRRGTYTVSLTVKNTNGSNKLTKTNYITSTAPAPVTAFTGSPQRGRAPLTVHFTDQSTNSPTAWLWSFGDNNTSTLKNPSHRYNTRGSYTVSLTATNAGGSKTLTKNNYIVTF
jgi:PKD repeat protein